MSRILLLAGTTEARKLAERLAGRDDTTVIASLAGVTRAPTAYPAPTRTGGFGGADGLEAWLRAERITLVVDATHPFAERISQNAATAANRACVRLIRLERPAWRAGHGDDWRPVRSIAEAIQFLPSGARAFLATGKGAIGQISGSQNQRSDIWCALRVADPPEDAFPFAHGRFVVERPPHSLTGEIRTLRDLAISHLVARNAGGASGFAKLRAARQIGIPVFMVERRKGSSSAGHTAERVDEAMQLIIGSI